MCHSSHCTLHTLHFISPEPFSPYPSSSLLISYVIWAFMNHFPVLLRELAWRKPGNLTGNLEIWRETWKFDGKLKETSKSEWKLKETWKFDGKPGNLTGNLEIWKGTWKFDGEPTNLTGVARNSSYADDSWLPLAFSVAHLAASSNCLLSLVLDLLVWFLTSNFGP